MKPKTPSAIAVEPVDKSLVHKHKIENVLVSNIRRPLPETISSEKVGEILPKLSDVNKKLFLLYYSKKNENTYILQSIKRELSIDDIRKRLNEQNFNRSDIRFFLKFFKKNKQSNQYVLQGKPDDCQLIRLARIINDKKNLISERDKSVLSDMLEGTDVDIDANIFYGNMIVDSNHYYFFEHPNEHVPGLMVVEAIRQLLVACSHKYGKVPVSGYNFILSAINIQFKNYVELNYPVLFKVRQTECHTYDTGIWADVAFNVSAIQNEIETTIQQFSGNIITSRVFNRLRTNKEQFNAKHWFILKTNVEYEIILRGSAVKKIPAQIEYISYKEIILITESPTDEITTEKPVKLEFFIYFSKIGFIHGLSAVKSINHFGNFTQIHLQFTDLDKADQSNLHEVIKKYGYLLED